MTIDDKKYAGTPSKEEKAARWKRIYPNDLPELNAYEYHQFYDASGVGCVVSALLSIIVSFVTTLIITLAKM